MPTTATDATDPTEAPSMGAPRRIRRLARQLAVAAISAYVVTGCVLTVQQDQLIFLADPESPSIEQHLPGGQVITARTSDGLDLAMWLLPANTPTSIGTNLATPCRHPAIVVFHGTGGNRSAFATFARSFAQLGFVTLLAEYRGYGGNPGRPTDDGLHADALAARDALIGRADVDPDRIAYFGDSLGTAVATRLATVRPPAALVLRSPFTSIPDIASTRLPMYPTNLLVHEQFRTIDRIATIHSPLLVETGSADTVVPVEQSREVFDAAPGPKQWVLRPGFIHEDPAWSTDTAYLRELETFLDAPLDPTRCEP